MNIENIEDVLHLILKKKYEILPIIYCKPKNWDSQ